MDSESREGTNRRHKQTECWLAVLLTIFVAAEAAAQVGARVVADFDGDGHNDLAIGEPGADYGRGAVTIYFGQGPSGQPGASLYLTGGSRGDNFGTAVAAADFSDFLTDGRSALVVGSPYYFNGSGYVQIFEISPTRTVYRSRGISQNSGDVQGVAASDDLFGAAVATGDFDGDGATDLAIGAPGEDLGAYADAGLVHVLYGPISPAFWAGRDYIWHQDRLPTIAKVHANEMFGYTLAAGDFNQDAIADLAVGVPFTGSSGDLGEINVIYGGRWGFGGSGALPPLRIDVSYGGLFGLALATGDINNDGYDDLVGGAPHSDYVRPGYVQDAGKVLIKFGSVAGLTGGQQLDQSLVSGYTPEPGDLFGYSLAVADFNGDGFADVAVGVPGETTDTAIRQAGLVHVFYGGSTGAQRSGAMGFDQDSPNVPGSSVARDFFGQTVAAGDFNDDGFADLIVAAPYKDLAGVANVGAAVAFFGTVNGISAINSQLLQPTRLYPGALFGYAMGR